MKEEINEISMEDGTMRKDRRVIIPFIRKGSNKIAKTFSKRKVGFSLERNILRILEEKGGKMKEVEMRGVVYKIKCFCGFSYIGQTKRLLEIRKKEQEEYVKNTK